MQKPKKNDNSENAGCGQTILGCIAELGCLFFPAFLFVVFVVTRMSPT